MGEIVNLFDSNKNKNSAQEQEVMNGDLTFMVCPCTDEGTPFTVLAEVAENPIVKGLVCESCEQFIPVNGGIVGKE